MPKRPTGLSAACFFPDRLRSGVVEPVFFPRGDPAADMALGLVHLQDVADTAIELWIDVLQAVGHVLMYSRFGYMKLLGGGADRRVVFNNILTEFDGSFFNGSFHVYHPLQLLATILCAASFEYAPFSAGDRRARGRIFAGSFRSESGYGNRGADAIQGKGLLFGAFFSPQG